MSSAVFPAFLGLSFDMEKEPIGGMTNIQPSVSGKESRIGRWSAGAGRYNIKLKYDFLAARQKYSAANMIALPSSQIVSSNVMANDWDALRAFFMARGGAGDDFLYSDPDEDPAVQTIFGTGDASSLVFQLYRTLGGAPLTAGLLKEIVQNPNGTPILPNGQWTASTSFPSTQLVLPSNDAMFLQSGRNGALVTPGWPLYFRSGGGTSGTIEPVWSRANIIGQTLLDGGITWTSVGVPFVVYLNGVAQATANYSVGSTGLITFTTPPGNGVVLSWTGDWYHRCRFAQDLINFGEFQSNFFEAGEVDLISLKI